MRLSNLTAFLFALCATASPILIPNSNPPLSSVNAFGKSLLALLPNLQTTIEKNPSVGHQIATDHPSFATQNGDLDIEKIRTSANTLAKAAPGQDISGVLGTAGSLASGLAGGIYDGVAWILSSEWSLISGIGKYLWSWVP